MVEEETQKPLQFQAEVERISEQLHSAGSFTNGTHSALIRGNQIEVRDVRGVLVAFSSTKADYDQSLAEFVADYLIR